MTPQIIFSKHALQRMRERFINQAMVWETIFTAEKPEQSQECLKRFLAKKVYYNEELAKTHLLMVVYEIEDSVIRVITVIDTSKIQKYL